VACHKDQGLPISHVPCSGVITAVSVMRSCAFALDELFRLLVVDLGENLIPGIIAMEVGAGCAHL
jgi:hypothetical protein